MFGAFNTFGKLGSPAGSRSLLAQIQAMGASFIGIPSLSNYQDSAGTTLVTQPGGGAADPSVGLALDLSQGLAFGSATSWDFSAGLSGWAAQFTSTQSNPSGVLRSISSGTNAGESSTPITCVIGKTYKITGDIVPGTSSGAISVSTDPYGGGAGSTGYKSSSGTYSLHFIATATTMYIICGNGSGTSTVYCDFDNISVRELKGNHATQSTSTARPKLSARVNLLTYTEDPSNSAWAKIGASTSVSKIIATAGAGAHYVRHLSSLTSATALSVEVKKDNHDWIFIGPSDAKLSFFNTATGNFGTLDSDVVSSSSVLLSDGYWRISLISNSAALTNLCALGLAASNGGTSFTAAGTEAFFVRNASLVSGSTPTRYQRVTDASNYDYSGFPLIHQFDAVDDAHVITFASSLGSDCTVVTANRGTTPTIQTAQTIGTSHTISATHAGKLIFPRALTAAETATVTAWATKQGAIA